MSTFLFNQSSSSIGNSPIVKRFLKGVFELRPPIPRYHFIWDVQIVLDYLKYLPPNLELSLRLLTYKLVMLLALTTQQRAQTLHVISIIDIKFSDNMVVIPIRKLIKQSSQRCYNQALYLKPYVDSSICVTKTLNQYLNVTRAIRGDCKQLFISFCKPHRAVSKDTISRWIKTVMFEAGIDTDMFKAHSTRAASTSAAKNNDVPLEHILKTAGWSNSNTFKKFYDKVILPRYI